jgi:hypothetical protein
MSEWICESAIAILRSESFEDFRLSTLNLASQLALILSPALVATKQAQKLEQTQPPTFVQALVG